MTHHEHTVKRVCKCENCGNEAEMEITCTLEDNDEAVPQEEGAQRDDSPETGNKVKGTATCSHCGSEADMWIDY